ncbi:L-fucose kinase, partial [Stegodyphus mimosarum]
MIKKWSIIVITCPTLSSVRAVETEVKFLKRKGRISEFVPVLCIEDHAKNIGSGAATLNALLVATEFLSVKNNYMVISSDVLLDEDILILHNGRDYLYSCCGKAFIPLPVEYTSNALNGKPSARGILLNFESVLGLIDELSEESPHGVWVCSTDMMIHQGLGKLCVDWKNVSDVLMFTVPSDLEYATGHGVVEVDSEGCIADIYYCASLSQIKNLSHGDEK